MRNLTTLVVALAAIFLGGCSGGSTGTSSGMSQEETNKLVRDAAIYSSTYDQSQSWGYDSSSNYGSGY